MFRNMLSNMLGKMFSDISMHLPVAKILHLIICLSLVVISSPASIG